MRIAYVYDAVHPWETGGVQTRVWELACRLADDHDVHWYGMQFWDGDAVRDREGVTLHGVTPPGSLYVNDRRSITEALRYTRHLVRPLLAEDFDVIDCQEFPYFPAFPSKLSSIAKGSTLVMTWHEVWGQYWYEYLGRKGVLGKYVERVVSKLPDEHIVVSAATQRDLRGLGVTDSRLIPNGISIAEIDRAPAGNEPVDIVFVGRLIPEKDPDLLVRAIDELREERPNITCRIIGEGPESDRVDRRIETLGLRSNIERTGFLESRAELIGVLKAAGVFALPSRREGFGITALEALACGTPVVTISHPQNAVTELIEHGETGLISDATPSGLATAIDRATRELSGDACIEAARAYEWNQIADQVEAFYLDAG